MSLFHTLAELSCDANGCIWEAKDVCVGLIDHLETVRHKSAYTSTSTRFPKAVDDDAAGDIMGFNRIYGRGRAKE